MSPIVTLAQDLDVFAFLDSDSGEARGFTTYLGYWDGLARMITRTYGSRFEPELIAVLQQRRPVRKLLAKRFVGDPQVLAKIVLNGWAQELGLYAVDVDDPRLMLQNLWNNVQSYYAASAVARAFLYVRSGEIPPQTHAGTLRAVAGLISQDLFPSPWNLCCTGEKPLTYTGFATFPDECHNLTAGPDCDAIVAKALKTTRKRDLDQAVAQKKQALKLARAPHGLRRSTDADSRATTVFDYLWRNRTRSNYGDPSMFYVGALSQERSVRYVESVRLVTSATMLLFEMLIAQRAPKALEETAIHFISRDRTKITDELLGGRLRAIGLLK